MFGLNLNIKLGNDAARCCGFFLLSKKHVNSIRLIVASNFDAAFLKENLRLPTQLAWKC